MKRVRLGNVFIDSVGFEEAIERIAALVESRQGGFVVTPNVDHVALADKDERLRLAYGAASLCLADGKPLLWLCRLLGHPLPEKVSGSDLMQPLLARAERESWRVYILGGAPGVGERAVARLCVTLPRLRVVGIDAPALGFETIAVERTAALRRLRAAAPDLVLMALGCPKQEILMYEWYRAIAPCVAIGVGASIDFLAGAARRAPAWMSRIGFEWLFRLAHEPRRLAKRYLVRDPAVALIALRMRKTPRSERAFWVSERRRPPRLPLDARGVSSDERRLD